VDLLPCLLPYIIFSDYEKDDLQMTVGPAKQHELLICRSGLGQDPSNVLGACEIQVFQFTFNLIFQ
jgi:hypothetical protein